MTRPNRKIACGVLPFCVCILSLALPSSPVQLICNCIEYICNIMYRSNFNCFFQSSIHQSQERCLPNRAHNHLVIDVNPLVSIFSPSDNERVQLPYELRVSETLRPVKFLCNSHTHTYIHIHTHTLSLSLTFSAFDPRSPPSVTRNTRRPRRLLTSTAATLHPMMPPRLLLRGPVYARGHPMQ